MTNQIISQFNEVPASKLSLSKRKLLYGIGINDADYLTNPKINSKTVTCPYYRVWQSMLTRCYSKKFQEINITYIGCSVIKEWYLFSNFSQWMETQDWQGKHLDKDIIIPGNKIYSPETCVFVTPEVNSLLSNRMAARGKYPQGVSWDKEKGKFKAECNINSKSNYLGYFQTVLEASQVYNAVKSAHIIDMAYQQNDSRIRDGLLIHGAMLIRNKDG